MCFDHFDADVQADELAPLDMDDARLEAEGEYEREEYEREIRESQGNDLDIDPVDLYAGDYQDDQPEWMN